MKIEDLAPTLEAWDRLTLALGSFTVAQPRDLTRRAAALSTARAEMARLDLPEPVGVAWSALQVSIGAALVAAPHELSAQVARMEERFEATRRAIWDLSKQATPVEREVIANLSAVAPARTTRRSRR